MLIALEGPDRCGKTTLFEALKPLVPATYVPSIGLPKVLQPFAAEVDARQLMLWNALYDPKKLYICDRSIFVTPAAYGRVVPYDHGYWKRELYVAYIRVPAEELLRREPDKTFTGDYRQIVAAYDGLVMNFQHRCFNGLFTPSALLGVVLAWINSLVR